MSVGSNTVPHVTVLMTCFNAARWLDESIDSVLNQTFSEFEFVIVDDGSTDNTLPILRGYAEHDERVIVFSKSNTGIADSLNVGLRSARGEWIARMDADDICDLTRLEKQLSFTKRHPNAVFVGSGLTIIDENGCSGRNVVYPSGHKQLLNSLLYERGFPPHASAFYKRDVVLSLGGYRKRIRRAEDYDLWLRLSSKGELRAIDEPLMSIRKHSDQITAGSERLNALLDCRIAIISYLLRRSGMRDPIDMDETSYLLFVNWVKSYMQSIGMLNYLEWKNNLRSNNKLLTFINMLHSTFQQPTYFLRLIMEKLLGDRFAFFACASWARKTKTDDITNNRLKK